jgi:hypothetical protein
MKIQLKNFFDIFEWEYLTTPFAVCQYKYSEQDNNAVYFRNVTIVRVFGLRIFSKSTGVF